jgi:hypothetical protein
MNDKSVKLIVSVLITLGVLTLAACTPETLQIGIEPTLAPSPTPTPVWQRYENREHGFSFGYPETWTLAEEPNVVTLRQGTLVLRIGFRWEAESIDISGGRSGMPAGEFVYGDKIFFLGQAIPAQVLQYERQDKMVLYDTSVIEESDLVFSIVLESVDNADYASLDIDKQVQAEVAQMLASFKRFEPTLRPTPAPKPSPATELATYTNDEYGFAFDYPAGWEFWSAESHLVQLERGSTSLHIGFMYLFESVDIWAGRQLPAGEIVQEGAVDFAGQALARLVIESGGEETAVYYGGAPSMINAGDVEFSIYATATAAIPAEDQAQMDAIVESFRLKGPSGPVTGDFQVVGWYGSVKSLPTGSQFDDYLVLLPDGSGEVGLAGSSPAIESQIVALRDKEPPAANANFWGTLTCDVPDYGGCQLLVTHLRPDGPGPLLNPDPVVGWQGVIFTNSAWPQIDDAFALAGPFPVYYGIWSEDATIAAQIEQLRNTGVQAAVWGQVLCGIPDANNCQIQVTRLESVALESPIEAQQTNVESILALQDVDMVIGPGEGYPVIGRVFAGQTALVTGVSPDGQWWRVICPDGKVGDCWISANLDITQQATPQDGQ